jgi:ADP-ribosylglycohydrolase
VKGAATGTLLGLAIGDAMGFPTEFSDMTQIAATHGPWRTMPLPVYSGQAYVTDDTQMTLALGEGPGAVSSSCRTDPGPTWLPTR